MIIIDDGHKNGINEHLTNQESGSTFCRHGPCQAAHLQKQLWKPLDGYKC